MSIPFSRSLRSLSLDSYRPARIGLVLGMVLLLVLILWFFFAKITIYQSSEGAIIDESGQITAEFSPQAIAQITPGQTAILRLAGHGDQQLISIPAIVYDLNSDNHEVIFYITDPSGLPESIPEGLTGRVDVEVEHISPFELVMRATGKFFNQTQT